MFPMVGGALTNGSKVINTPVMPICIDAFCGAGGLSLGLRRAGFDLRAAFDWDRWSVETYRRNIGDHVLEADASTLRGADLRSHARLRGDQEITLFAGGPPCQGFSKQKRGAHLGDDRNRLVLEYLRLVRELRPQAFLLENVSQLAQARGRHLVSEITSALHGDYQLTGHFYVAADYGVAQTRERFVMVGMRNDVAGSFHIPAPTSRRWPTVGEVIGELPDPPNDYTEHPDYANHQAARVTHPNIERFAHVPEGGGWQDIPYELRLRCHQNGNPKAGGWPDVYGRLRWDGQCPTITGGFDSFTRGRYGHPRKNRPLTPREAARLQGFPDDFVFLGTRHDIRHQIGNAVPVSLAEAIGTAVWAALNGATPNNALHRQLMLSYSPSVAVGAK
jgi:DNA (cytosine-5)-methyltransferase 1